MGRMLQPVPARKINLQVSTGAHNLAQRQKSGGGASNQVVAGVALGFTGLPAAVAIGQALQGEAGGEYGAMIGAPLGALLGVWIGGR